MERKAIETILPAGSRISVCYAVADRVNYDSVVNDYTKTHILIAMPTHKGKPLSISRGVRILVSAFVAGGKVTFFSNIEGVAKDEAYSLSIKLPEKYELRQLREYFRVSTHIKVRVFIGSLEEYKLSTDLYNKQFVGAIIDNISGGGCRIITTAEISTRDLLVINFTDTPLANIGVAECRVIRKHSPSGERKFMSLNFTHLDEITRDNIARYVLRRQVELRQIE